MFFWMCPFYYICLLWVDHEGVVFLLRQKCLDFKRKSSRHRNEYLEYTCRPECCMDFSFVLLLYFQKDVTKMHVLTNSSSPCCKPFYSSCTITAQSFNIKIRLHQAPIYALIEKEAKCTGLAVCHHKLPVFKIIILFSIFYFYCCGEELAERKKIHANYKCDLSSLQKKIIHWIHFKV